MCSVCRISCAIHIVTTGRDPSRLVGARGEDLDPCKGRELTRNKVKAPDLNAKNDPDAIFDPAAHILTPRSYLTFKRMIYERATACTK